MKPRWLVEFDEARQAGAAGVILTFVTTDRVIYPELGPPLLLRHFLARYLTAQGYAVARYSLASGMELLRPPGAEGVDHSALSRLPQAREPEVVLPALNGVLRSAEHRVAILVDYADHLVPAAHTNALLAPTQTLALELLHGWGIDQQVRASKNLLVLISHENQVHDLLRRGGCGYRLIRIDLPEEGERLEFIRLLHGSGSPEFGRLAPDLTPEQLARVTGGLRATDIEAVFRLAGAKGEPVTRRMVVEQKAQAIRELGHGLVEVIEPAHGFEAVAGLRHAVDYFSDLRAADRLPPGVILAGVPGCGKSFLVPAAAREFGYPCLAMRNVREQWVGASERNLELVLWIAETLAPCVMWIDEIDQFLGQRSTGASADAGTSERMLSRLWEFMGDTSRGRRVFWIGTTNRPDLLDPATLDRFPVVIPFVHPSPGEVAEMLPVVAAQVGRELAGDVRAREIAALPTLELPTVRALLEIVSTAGVWADLDAGAPGAPIDHAHLEAAALDYKPNYDPLMHRFVALKAIQMTTFQHLLPWRGRRGVREGVELPAYLKDLVDAEGRLDHEALESRLQEMQRELTAAQLMRQV